MGSAMALELGLYEQVVNQQLDEELASLPPSQGAQTDDVDSLINNTFEDAITECEY
jgi:hypothetical protein